MQIYYSPDFGYIVCATTTIRNTPMRVVINPVTVLESNAATATLGSAIFNSLEQSRKARPISRKKIEAYHFWQVSGIKGFASFSKKFQCVTIREKGAVLQIVKLVRETDGSYTEPVNQFPIPIPANTAAERLGEIIFNLFLGQNEPCTNNTMTFETVHKRFVTYRRPPDEYLDCGDNHTDAYQVFSLANAPQNRIAFLVDSGYSELSETAIQKKWQEQYGNLAEFCFQPISAPPLLCKASGKTADTNIISYLYQDGTGTMEVVALIDLQQPREIQEKVRAEFATMISSLQN